MSSIDANGFNISSDFPLLINDGFITLQVSVPGGVSLGVNGQQEYSSSTTIPAGTCEQSVAKVYSSANPSQILIYPENGLTRNNYSLRALITTTDTTVAARVFMLGNPISSTTSGPAETIYFRIRPLGQFF